VPLCVEPRVEAQQQSCDMPERSSKQSTTISGPSSRRRVESLKSRYLSKAETSAAAASDRPSEAAAGWPSNSAATHTRTRAHGRIPAGGIAARIGRAGGKAGICFCSISGGERRAG
jgi:hypothetical protein